ncbi:MAG: hypothetical protein ACYC46_16100 [Acidobacteriaceae bacterium]
MNNDLAVLSMMPAHIQAAAAQAAAANLAMSAGISVGFSRISLKASRFRIVQGEVETALDTMTLPAVLLTANAGISKAFYAKAWQPGDAEAPDCSSSDGVMPDAGVPAQQAASCAGCPMNQWGSKLTPAGKQIKACSDTKKLAIVAASAIDGELYLLSVPAASLKPLAQYINMLSQRGVAAHMVETSISFDTTADYPRLLFNVARFLTQEEMQKAVERLDDPMIPTIVGAVQRPAQLAAPTMPPVPDYVLQAAEQAKAKAAAEAKAREDAEAAYRLQALTEAEAAAKAQALAEATAALRVQAAKDAAAQAAPAVGGFGAPQQALPGFGAPAAVATAKPAGFGAPASNVVSAAFGAQTKPAPIAPAGGEIMPPPAVMGDALSAAVMGALDQFDD